MRIGERTITIITMTTICHFEEEPMTENQKRDKRTNRQAHEEAAGMALENAFFFINGIDPDAEYKDEQGQKENP